MDLPRPVTVRVPRESGGGERTAFGRVIDRSLVGRGKGRGGADRRPPPSTSTVDLHSWRRGLRHETARRQRRRARGGKVAAEVDCNWFILINDDLLCGSRNGNSGTVGRRPNTFLGLSLTDRTILFLVILVDKTVSVG